MLDDADLARFIQDNDVDGEIVFLQDETPTVEAAADAVGVAPRQILKSLLFVIKEGEDDLRPLLVIANGLSRVSYKKLAAHEGVSRRQVRIARPKQVAAITGYAVGTVPPFGHSQPLPTLIDEGVLAQSEVYAGGGAINALLRLDAAELQRVVQANVASLTE